MFASPCLQSSFSLTALSSKNYILKYQDIVLVGLGCKIIFRTGTRREKERINNSQTRPDQTRPDQHCLVQKYTYIMSLSSFDYALRVVESIAFYVHGILGVTEPFTGCLRSTFGDKGAMPSWFWPVAGLVLWTVATLNLVCSRNDVVILGLQLYIATFHSGAVLYHGVLGHEPVVGIAPGMFVVIAISVIFVRTQSILYALVAILVSAGLASVLCKVLVTPPNGTNNDNDELLSPEERAQAYLSTETTTDEA